MQFSNWFGRHTFATIVLVPFVVALSSAAFAESPVKLQGGGSIAVSTEGPSTFTLDGTASHLGKYTCYGEIDFTADENADGIAVFEAANGDLLVGIVGFEFGPNGIGQMKFSWRDSVQFSDGNVVSTTGRFVESRPPGAIASMQYNHLVVIAIIAILIG